MRILVYGGRDYNPTLVVAKLSDDRFLEKLIQSYRPFWDWDTDSTDIVIIQGGARGADFGAAQFADYFGLKMEEYKAEWKKYGKSAGPLRNKRMIDEGKPELGIAFPGGKGTMNMTSQLKKANIPVFEVVEPL